MSYPGLCSEEKKRADLPQAYIGRRAMDAITIKKLNKLVELADKEAERAYKRANLLQADLDKADKLHFDECEKLHKEIAELRAKLKKFKNN